jgi:glycosyltransferase involved in cell wall biosynthesis
VVLPTEDRVERRRRARDACGVPRDALVAALAAPACGPGTELEVFLRAASSLCNAREQAHVLLPPPGGVDHASLQATVAWTVPTLARNGRAHIAPAEPDAGAIVCDAADVAVFCPDSAALPLALLQAMAAGTAVIAADTPLVREFVEAGTHALLVPGADHEALATALLALGDDPVQRSTLAAAGAALVRERHDADLMAREIEELYASLA